MSEGLLKLTEYLNQTRRQAEQAIDVLNSKIFALTDENTSLRQQIVVIESERNTLRVENDHLRVENPKKWRFQERDDWKALVESVQKDRSRLQEDCVRLENCLEEAKEQISRLEEETIYLSQSLRKYRSMEERQGGDDFHSTDYADEFSHLPAVSDNSFPNHDNEDASLDFIRPPNLSITIDSIEIDDLNTSLSESPQRTPSSPRALMRTLTMELELARAQMEVERKIAETEKFAQDDEIRRLRNELETLQTLDGVTSMNSIPKTVSGARSAGAGALNRTVIASATQPQPASTWFGLIGSIFYAAPTARTNSRIPPSKAATDSNGRVLQV